MDEPISLSPSPVLSVEEASRAVLALRDIEEPAVLVDSVKSIIQRVGGEVFVFHSRFVDEGGRECYRYLIGCPPEFCQEYNAHKWREVDPVLAYAMHHMRPVLSDDFRALSVGQQELMSAAKKAGFGSCVGVPVRDVGNTRMGVLYVGAEDAKNDELLYAGQGLLLHLANELLDWIVHRVRQQELGDIKLDSLDQYILRYCYQGFTAEQIAGLCDVPVTRIRNRMRRLNEKFHAANHKVAVTRAIEMGLLRVHECMDNSSPNQPDLH